MKMRWRILIVELALLAMIGVVAAEESPDPAAEAEVPTAPAEAATMEPKPAARSAYADRLELETTSIRGNQELPRILYIVPWKDPSLGDVTGKPVNSLVDEVLAPLDRDVFLRQTNYFDQLYGSPETGVSD